MNFEVLKISHIKRNIIIAVIIVLILSAVILTFTRAKYRTTQSIPLIQGTINFSPSDLNLIAVYLNKNGDTISSDKVPHVGYTLNTEQSICEVNDVEDLETEIVYENGYLYVNKLSHKGTKCTAYFDLIPDSENPVINSISTTSLNDSSVTIKVNATDNIGIYYYYYKLDNEEEVRTEENSYTFEELEEDSVHTITVRVEDAVGNVANDSKEVIVGYKASDVILASSPTQGETTDWTGGTTYYYTGNPNNWVQFGGFYWRIIRINGDGTIRMIYQGTSANTTGTGTQIQTSGFNSTVADNMYVGYMYTRGQLHGLGTSSMIKGVLDTWYMNNIANMGYGDYVDGNAGFCGDRRVSSGSGTGQDITTYQVNTRLSSGGPSLSCEEADMFTTSGSSIGNKALTYPIGLVTADEVVLAGGSTSSGNSNYYLYTSQNYWTMSPYQCNGNAYVYLVYDNGYLGNDYFDYNYVNRSFGVRPVINLRSDVALSGSGTTTDPFKVVGAE